MKRCSRLEHKASVADTKLHYERTVQENPELRSGTLNRFYQKHRIQKEYAEARKASTGAASAVTNKTGKSVREKAADKVREFIANSKKTLNWLGVGVGCIVLFAAGFSSCTAMFTQTGQGIIASSYLSEDEAMLGAEQQYCQMETDLQEMLDNYEATHSYDEYHFDLDDIEHDPYVLISILSALHEAEFTLDEVQGTLEMLFDKQYILTENVVVETRYRTERRTDARAIRTLFRVPMTTTSANVTWKTSISAMFRFTSCPKTSSPCILPICPWLATVRTCSRTPSMWINTSIIPRRNTRSTRTT